jgi:hypothetical protein
MDKNKKRKNGISRRRQNINDGTGCDNIFYSTPDSKLLTILIILAIVIVIFFFFVFKYVTRNWGLNDVTNNVVGAYLGIIAVPVGVVLSFIVASAWTSFSDAEVKASAEATQLYLLFGVVRQLPGTEDIQQEIMIYLRHIINVEFPLMAKGIQSEQGLVIVTRLGEMIYGYDPTTDRETVLYKEAIQIYEQSITLRITRLSYVTYGVVPELWWVLILGVVIVLVSSYFIYSSSIILQAIMISLATATLVSMLFIILTLNYPYRGSFSIDALPYEIGLDNMERLFNDTSSNCRSNKSRNKYETNFDDTFSNNSSTNRNNRTTDYDMEKLFNDTFSNGNHERDYDDIFNN